MGEAAERAADRESEAGGAAVGQSQADNREIVGTGRRRADQRSDDEGKVSVDGEEIVKC